jgi:DNA-binding LacI/PurR family transcriptional regulator
VGVISADPISAEGDAADETNAHFYEHFARRAHQLGILLRKEWVCRPLHKPSGEEHAPFGYDQFHALWRQRERPEALVIWPDSVAYGALLAISEQGVRIPQELKLILHKNDAVDLFCPVPGCFVVTRVREVAAALWEQILRQSRGERCRTVLVPFQLQQANAPRQQIQGTAK